MTKSCRGIKIKLFLDSAGIVPGIADEF